MSEKTLQGVMVEVSGRNASIAELNKSLWRLVGNRAIWMPLAVGEVGTFQINNDGNEFAKLIVSNGEGQIGVSQTVPGTDETVGIASLDNNDMHYLPLIGQVDGPKVNMHITAGTDPSGGGVSGFAEPLLKRLEGAAQRVA